MGWSGDQAVTCRLPTFRVCSRASAAQVQNRQLNRISRRSCIDRKLEGLEVSEPAR